MDKKRIIKKEEVEIEAKKMIDYCLSDFWAIPNLCTETDVDITKHNGRLAYITAAFNMLENTNWDELKKIDDDKYYEVQEGSPVYEFWDGLIWVVRDNVKTKVLNYMKDILSDEELLKFEFFLDDV